MSDRECYVCHGRRLKPEALAVTVGELNIAEICELAIKDSYQFFQDLQLSDRDQFIAKEILKEINQRLKFLIDVGLDYISLSRSSGTFIWRRSTKNKISYTDRFRISGGMLYFRWTKYRIASKRDNLKLIDALKHLRDIGNTLIIVEHDEETILSADYVVDSSPGAGEHGGNIVAAGTPLEIMESPDSITGKYLSRKETILIPKTQKKW